MPVSTITHDDVHPFTCSTQPMRCSGCSPLRPLYCRRSHTMQNLAAGTSFRSPMAALRDITYGNPRYVPPPCAPVLLCKMVASLVRRLKRLHGLLRQHPARLSSLLHLSLASNFLTLLGDTSCSCVASHTFRRRAFFRHAHTHTHTLTRHSAAYNGRWSAVLEASNVIMCRSKALLNNTFDVLQEELRQQSFGRPGGSSPDSWLRLNGSIREPACF